MSNADTLTACTGPSSSSRSASLFGLPMQNRPPSRPTNCIAVLVPAIAVCTTPRAPPTLGSHPRFLPGPRPFPGSFFDDPVVLLLFGTGGGAGSSGGSDFYS